MPKKDSCRKWFCRVSKVNNTSQGLYEYDFDELYKTLTEKFNVLFALHDKDINNVHCHIVIQSKNQVEFDRLKKLIPYGDIEKQRGSNKECYEYCLHIDEKSKKREKIQYNDSCIKTNIEDLDAWKKLDKGLGARNDLVQIMEDIKNGADKYELMDNYPSQYVRYATSFQKIQQDLLEKQGAETFRKLEVYYISGSTGIGKTRYVMEKYGYANVFRITEYGNGAFDNYNGQDVILFDEFRSFLPLTKMLVYLDGYPVTLPCRYYNKQALFTKVYIISNIPLSAQYTNVQKEEPKTYNAFLRRITAVYDFDKSKDTPITHDARLTPVDIDADIFGE